MKKILFVCTGNTCRSSMAEGIMKAALEKEDVLAGKYEVMSAGIYASEGDRASTNAVSVLKNEWGIDIARHRSKQLSSWLVNEAFIILALTRNHKEAILSRYPEAKAKVFTLKEYVSLQKPDNSIYEYNFSLDIADPFGMPYNAYKGCAEEILSAVKKLVSILKQTER